MESPAQAGRLMFIRRAVWHYVAPLLVLASCAAGFLVLGAQKTPPRRMPLKASRALVRTVPLQPYDGPIVIATSGLVSPFREIEVAAEVRGKVLRKNPLFEVGRHVAEGTELVAIDPAEYELAVSRLAAQLEQADAELAEIDAQLAGGRRLAELARLEASFAEKNLQRINRLRQSNAVTEADFDNEQRKQLAAEQKVAEWENQLVLLDAQYKRLEAARKTVEMQLAQARLDLRRTVVVAPLSGFIVSERAQRGAYLQPGDPIAVIEDAAAVEVQCQLRMDELRWVLGSARGSRSQRAESPDDNAPTRSPAHHDESQAEGPGHDVQDYELPPVQATVHYRLENEEVVWQGVLSGFDQLGLNEKTRTAPCRVLVSQPRSPQRRPAGSSWSAERGPRALIRGMFVEVRLHCETRQPLMQLPEVALLPGDRAWVVADGRLQQVRLDVVGVRDGTVIIAGAHPTVRHDQRVVVSPIAHAVEGLEVREEDALAHEGGSKTSFASRESGSSSERSAP